MMMTMMMMMMMTTTAMVMATVMVMAMVMVTMTMINNHLYEVSIVIRSMPWKKVYILSFQKEPDNFKLKSSVKVSVGPTFSAGRICVVCCKFYFPS